MVQTLARGTSGQCNRQIGCGPVGPVQGLSKSRSAHLPSEPVHPHIGSDVFRYLALASRRFFIFFFSLGVSTYREVQVSRCLRAKFSLLACVDIKLRRIRVSVIFFLCLRTLHGSEMPGVARTLALKAQKSHNGMWCLETKSFLIHGHV